MSTVVPEGESQPYPFLSFNSDRIELSATNFGVWLLNGLQRIIMGKIMASDEAPGIQQSFRQF